MYSLLSSMQAHLRSHDSCAEDGWSVCMHVDAVEATTASMIVALSPAAAPQLWALTGHPCRREYVSFSFTEAATTDFTDV